MKSDFHDEILRRREERRRKRSNTWLNLIIRIIALIFVIAIIRYFGTVRVEQLERKSRNSVVDSTQIFFPDKNNEN
ncbi:MAG: hypothetical protein DRI23_04130 [Candidatus Cloacimonadota bacterium]|nr:MAG: hypothetical protein DRI23_04130 [Candidatus Cloacimonadota bacterium]